MIGEFNGLIIFSKVDNHLIQSEQTRAGVVFSRHPRSASYLLSRFTFQRHYSLGVLCILTVTYPARALHTLNFV